MRRNWILCGIPMLIDEIRASAFIRIVCSFSCNALRGRVVMLWHCFLLVVIFTCAFPSELRAVTPPEPVRVYYLGLRSGSSSDAVCDVGEAMCHLIGSIPIVHQLWALSFHPSGVVEPNGIADSERCVACFGVMSGLHRVCSNLQATANLVMNVIEVALYFLHKSCARRRQVSICWPPDDQVHGKAQVTSHHHVSW